MASRFPLSFQSLPIPYPTNPLGRGLPLPISLPVDLEPSGVSASAGPFSTSYRFFVDPFLGPFLDLFLLASPALSGRSKIPLGRPLGNFVGIWDPNWAPESNPNWVPKRFRCRFQRKTLQNAKTTTIVMPNGSGHLPKKL